jgi:hypothetical protein
MSDTMALKIAIDIMHVPSQVRLVRAEPLPDGVLMLLRIAAGDEEAQRTAAVLTDRPLNIVRQAAAFFIEQILFAPNADSYQVLGASPEDSASELRRNLALLMRWLHPDLDPRGDRSIFISKVTTAWNNLKTPERRAVYDDQRRRSNDKSKSRTEFSKTLSRQRSNRERFVAVLPRRHGRGRDAASIYSADKVGFLRRALSILFHTP